MGVLVWEQPPMDSWIFGLNITTTARLSQEALGGVRAVWYCRPTLAAATPPAPLWPAWNVWYAKAWRGRGGGGGGGRVWNDLEWEGGVKNKEV